MHGAPAVSYPAGRSRFQGWLLALTALSGGLTGWLWQSQSDSVGWRHGLFTLALLGALLLAGNAWRRSPAGHLSWDGQGWTWLSAEGPVGGVLAVHLDLQFCLVVSLRPMTGPRLWLWPERRSELARWSALRRAVFARGVSATGQDASALAGGIDR